MGAASTVVEVPTSRSWLAVLVLAAANLGLVLIVSSGLTVFADIIAPLTGHLIGFGLAASLALVVRRRMLTLLVAGIAATLALHAWLGLARCCRAPEPAAQTQITRVAAQATPQRLSVMALNTWHALRDPSRIARYLATTPADIVIISQIGQAKQSLLAELRDAYPYQAGCADGPTCSLALLSRLPLGASGVGRVAADGPDFVWARLGTSLTIVGTHVDGPSRNPWRHAQQMAALGQFLRRIDGPVVLAGDLNTSPWSGSFRRLRAATGLAPASVLMPTWPAWPVALPQVALDHILVSPDVAVKAAGTGPAVGSDRLPIWVQLDRRPGGTEPRHQKPRRLISRLAAAGPHLGGELLGDIGSKHVGSGHLSR